MASMTTFLALGAAFASVVHAGAPESCPANGQLSCHNTTVQTNTCCFNSPGGSLLQTQFWDTDPASGPTNSWTVHGLWPDECNGQYQSNCDPNRAYTNITSILQSFGANSLLSYMQTYWTSNDGTEESFWDHEWEKHATCISTLQPSCYTNYQPQEEVVDFFNTTVNLFKTLDSYSLLSAAGIVPSNSATYSLTDVQNALANGHGGHIPYVGCASGAIDEIWYYFNVRGSVQTGTFVPADSDGSTSPCPATVSYLPKGSGSSAPTSTTSSPGSTKTTTTTTSAAPTSTGGSGGGGGSAFNGKGTMNVMPSGGSSNGCIISGGTWYTTGTCATFTGTPSGSGFTLTSSKGPCAVISNVLSCASGNTAGVFGQDGNGALTYGGSNVFSAAKTPTGSDQEKVSPGGGNVDITIVWQSS